jgi:photosystem II stability/assembly factor-like uncharacterized protein
MIFGRRENLYCIVLLCLFVFSARVTQAEPRWEQIPLKTQVQYDNGFSGGDGFQYVHSISYASSDPSRAYLTVDTSAVWRSDDGGISWSPRFNGFNAYGGRSLAVDPHNPNVVIVAGFLGFDKERADKYPKLHQGIYMTLDGGESWKFKHETNFYKQESKGELFVFIPGSENAYRTSLIYCGSFEDGLLLSEDGGNSWRTMALKGIEILAVARGGGDDELLVATKNGLYRYANSVVEPIGRNLPSWPRSIATSREDGKFVIYAALGEAGVFKSVDDGNSFIRTRAGLPVANWTDVAASLVDMNQVYVRCDRYGLPPYYSSDGGATWNAPDNPDEGGILEKPGFFFSSPFATHPREPKIALHVTNGRARIIRTMNGGATWKYSGDGFTGARMTSAGWLDGGSHIFSLTDHGLWRSRENGIYEEIPLARMFGRVSSRSIAVNGSHVVASLGQWTKQGLIVSHDEGRTWERFENLDDRYDLITFSPKEPATVFAGKYVSRDNGRHWASLGRTIAAISKCGILYALDGEGGKGGSENRVIFRSEDDGRTWVRFGTSPVHQSIIHKLVVDPSNASRLFLATTRGLYIGDGGKWDLKDYRDGLSKDAFGTCGIKTIAFDPFDSKRIYVGRHCTGFGNANGVFVSDDGGENWTNANYNLEPGFSVYGLEVSPLSGTVYLGSSFGTFRLVN